MVRTSTRHRRRTLRRNRRIPTILGEVFDGGLIDVSAVDTGRPAGSTPPGLGRRGRALSPHGWEPPRLELVAPSSARPLLTPVWGPEVVVGRRRRRSRRTSGSGCQGRPTLRRRGWGHPARAGTFLCGRGQVTRSGTGLLSPTASNAPARKDTHPAARNVPVVGGGASATETWGSCPHRRNARGPASCVPTRRTGCTSGADGDRHNTTPSKGPDWCPRPGKPEAPVT